MWTTQLWHLMLSAAKHALTNGSSTSISVVWLGLCAIIFTFIFYLGVVWLTGGRNMNALKVAFGTWKSVLSAILGFTFVWLMLFGYSLIQTVYRDHGYLVAENTRLNQENAALSAPKTTRKNLAMTSEQYDAIVAHMKPFKSTRIVEVCRDCDDENGSAWLYSVQMAKALRQDGIEVDGPHHSRDRSIPVGVYVYYGSDQLQAKTAFTDALTPFHVLNDESDGSSGFAAGKMSVSIRP